MKNIINPNVFATCLMALLLAIGAGHAAAEDLPPGSVNINTADATALAGGLSGVGASRAEDIVRYREEFGPFTTLEQLTEVKGIGQATVDRNRSVITLD
ncbi:competence protein ComEA [Halioglobus maricola]|uniref:Competence protein ComEA n=1 Tax=Halioglobus maricola TaxID=2601894 RepID=A0A5P9NHN3_9GAMM|nr:helix-hairpin-helix domain-containing protein [Halioglobus maricola]QFU75337.1 competence protein ComEA [Halioglobus maricola]